MPTGHPIVHYRTPPIIGIGLRQAIAANFIMAAGREGGLVSAPTAKADDN